MEVMESIRLKSVINTVVKMLASSFNIPKTLFKTWLRIQIKILSLPLYFFSVSLIHAIRKYSQSGNAPALPEPSEPKSEDIVNQTKRLRSAVLSISTLTGQEFFWDLPLMDAKSKRYKEAVKNRDYEEMKAAEKAIKEHPVKHPVPVTRMEYNRLLQEARYGPNYKSVKKPTVMTEPKLKNLSSQHHKSAGNILVNDAKPGPSNILKTDAQPKLKKNATPQHQNAVHTGLVRSDAKAGTSNVSKTKKKVDFLLDGKKTIKTNREETHCKYLTNKRCAFQQNKRLRNELITTSRKFEQLLRTSDSLLKEVKKLNEQLNKLTNISTIISNLQDEINEGKKLLSEIEQERDEMKRKLLAIEQLIKEEEDYLDDLSCESGYEEVVCDSHDEL